MHRQKSTRPWPWSRLAGSRTRNASTSRSRELRPIPAATSRWTPSSARRPRASTPRETSPGTSWSCTRPRARPTSQRPMPPSEAPRSSPRRSARWAASPIPNTPLSDSPRRPLARPMTSSWGLRASTPCRARSSTVAPRGSASSSSTAGTTRSSAATSWVSVPSNLLSWRHSPSRPARWSSSSRWFPSRSPPTPTGSDAQRSEPRVNSTLARAGRTRESHGRRRRRRPR